MNDRRTIRNHGARGFTLVELSIGLVFTALLAVVVGGFTAATFSTWRESGDEQALRLSAEATMTRIAPALRSAPQVAAAFVRAGSSVNRVHLAGIYFWANDGAQGLSDRRPQVGEMGLIEFDDSTGTLWLYTAKPTARLTTAEIAAANATMTKPLFIDHGSTLLLKAASWVQARPLFGTGTLVTDAKKSRLTEATFSYAPAADGSKASVDVTLTLLRGERVVTETARFTLRGPITWTGG